MTEPGTRTRFLRETARSWIERPMRLLALGLLLLVAVLHLWLTPSNPPGFHRDEASISLNAYLLSQDLHDENGALFPLYFPSFDDYKSPVFVYALTGAFAVTGPDSQVARGLAAVSILGAVLLLALLAYRLTGSGAVAVATVLLAATAPWIFNLGRIAFEVSMEPLVIALLLLSLERARRRQFTDPWSALAAGAGLGALLYVYAGGRVLGFLFAGALAVFAGRGRWRWLVGAWATFAVAAVPLLLYSRRHPGALSARFEAQTFIQEGMSWETIVRTAASNYLHDMALWRYVVEGDPKPYAHIGGTGALLGAFLALAVAGAALVAVRRRGDLWWRYVLVITLLAPVPASVTFDRLHAFRLAVLPVLLIVLAIPAVELLVRLARSRWDVRIFAALAASGIVQFTLFLDAYVSRGPARTVVFEAGVPELVDRGLQMGTPLYIDFDDDYAQTHARWRVAERGMPPSTVSVLPDGGIPPPGSTVFGRFQPCDYECKEVDRVLDYWIAVAVGPRP